MSYGYGRRRTGSTVSTYVGLIVAGLLISVVVSLVVAIPVFFLWNWLMPVVFGVKAITFLQAWGLLLLASFFFKPPSTTVSAKRD
jgi:hypothetical protein